MNIVNHKNKVVNINSILLICLTFVSLFFSYKVVSKKTDVEFNTVKKLDDKNCLIKCDSCSVASKNLLLKKVFF